MGCNRKITKPKPITIGIRCEDKSRWERRTPIVPADAKNLQQNKNVNVVVQSSPIRVYSDKEYAAKGIEVSKDLGDCKIILGVKEVPLSILRREKVYLFFSHTCKGQAHGIPLLKRIMRLRSTLIDYEKIVDGNNSRLVFFGHQAGQAGVIDALWALGRRLKHEGVQSPFVRLKQAWRYKDLSAAKKDFKKIAIESVRQKQWRCALRAPFVIGITGNGHTSRGVQEMLSFVGAKKVFPNDLVHLKNGNGLYYVVFDIADTVIPNGLKTFFSLADYEKHPGRYRSCFQKYLPFLTVWMNCVYWDKRYPRLATIEEIRNIYQRGDGPKVIGDISCDLNGSCEATVRFTDQSDPVFLYDVINNKDRSCWTGVGPLILAVDNLPCELARDSSRFFSKSLLPLLSPVVDANFEDDFKKLMLPPEVKNALIIYSGKLTPSYRYLKKYL